MRQKLLMIIIFAGSISTICSAQTKRTALVKGRLFNTTTKTAFSDLKVSIPELSAFTNADAEGNFTISEVPYGRQTIVISGPGAKRDTLSIDVNSDVADMHNIQVTPDKKHAAPESNEIPTIAVNDNSSASEDDGVSSINSGEALSSRDPFLGAVEGFYGLYNFHYRGYVKNPHETQVNGITINNLETGSFNWDQVGRSYDVFHYPSVSYGISHSDYTFGGINGSQYYNATAANQQKETKISYTVSDRNNSNGVMITENSGLMKNGWAYSASFSKRYAAQGYTPGTFYDDYYYYAGVSKTIKKGTLNLTSFGSSTDQGKAGTATKEVFDLAGTNYYNHSWGDYNGRKRNSKVERLMRPITILNYEYNPSDATRWNTAIGYEFGKDRKSGIEGYGVSSIIGDYYRNLPSYYLTMAPPDSVTANLVRQKILSNPGVLQLQWDQMYQENFINQRTIYNANGIAGYNYTGRQSQWVLGDAVDDRKKFTFNTNIEHSVNEHLSLFGGLTFTAQHSELYKQLTDLLGGDYFVNYNIFASQQYIGNPTFNQNNLNTPNAIVKVGDKYDYDYAIRTTNSLAWGQAVYTYNRFNLFAAVNAGDNSFSRDGYYRNGLFANNSFGKSPAQNFFTYAAKGGASYNLNARNAVFVSALYSATPPSVDNTYISAQTRDFVVNNPTVQTNQAMECGYSMKSSKLSLHATGYVTDSRNITEIKRFYNDDPAYFTFVNYVMQGENTRQTGVELSANYRLTHTLSITGVAVIGQAFYTNRPNISQYLDNDTTQHPTSSTAYIKNYYLGTGPQTIYILSAYYRPRRDFYVNLNFNYSDRHYVEINPSRRTPQAAGLYPAGSPMWHEIFDQEELPAVFTVDLRAGKTFQLSRVSKMFDNLSHNTVLSLYASIGNLLNNTNIINFGYEQLRFDYVNNNPAKFANKYMYGYGINFSLNAALRF